MQDAVRKIYIRHQDACMCDIYEIREDAVCKRYIRQDDTYTYDIYEIRRYLHTRVER